MLRIPFAINILILAPVCWAMWRASDGGFAVVFGGRVAPSEGLRLIVWSMWLAILLASVAGLVWPQRLLPVLGIQIVYKSLWLLLFVWPAWKAGGWVAVPQGVAASFIFIVLVWPYFLWRGLVSG